MKTFVAGHNGLVGSALVRAIENQKHHDWIGASRSELNLLDRKLVFDYLRINRPNNVIVAAAKVGGILANKTYPVEFLSENLQIQTNILDACAAAQIEKVIFLGSSCIYPKLASQPITEDQLLTGPLEKTNEAYAVAKIAGIKLVEAYNVEYGYNWISAMPTNLYGPRDNFDIESSHVLPALIRKIHEAKTNQNRTVTLWGSGLPRREFLYSDDAASALLFLLTQKVDQNIVNIGTGHDQSISELANLISEIIGFKGNIEWDASKPDGTPRKLLDVSKMQNLGWKSKITLEDGIRQTYKWFLSKS